ncbi:hypothetical protein ER308_02860 [Egibacter rhizosphaerae]|uniref:Uncharacterized protein n=1 Tax=Egibacter rhizosphaerae TaxID=1670831 RepID=A0A411YBQ4_9ACTN|nr:hypothetical protein [Egibacter rhizosphaerae]QBI18608.1 hypothetical protein ER308_02860 [Egibacter rhizosphaerae]
MEQVKPRELIVAARVADALVYAAGVAGVVAGGVLFMEGQRWFAVVAWVLTFVAGAALRLAAWAAKALAELLERTARMERDLTHLLVRPREQDPGAGPHERDLPPGFGDSGGRRPGGRDEPPDPWKRLGGWH